MPGLDGLALIRKIRAGHLPGEVYILIVTGRGETEDVVEALEAGADDFICKPFARAELRVRLGAGARIVDLYRRLKDANDQLEARNAFIRRVLGRYVTDEVVCEILDQPEGLELRGESREVTILLSDLRGFSPLCERLEPQEVMSLLNLYLGAMTEIIQAHGGTIDEFTGDGILVFFGAPVWHEDDALRALRCGARMQRGMAEVNAALAERGLPRVEMGVAINTGQVVAGNIGSERRAKYAVVGEPINLCARIESVSVGGQLLLSPRTTERVGDALMRSRSFEIGPKGYIEPLTVTEALAVAGEDGETLQLPSAQDDQLAPAEPPISIHFVAIDDGRSKEHEGTVVARSERRVRVQGPAIELLSNLRVQIDGLPEAGILYAKVTATHDDGFEMRFTSVPPEFAKVLSEGRQA